MFCGAAQIEAWVDYLTEPTVLVPDRAQRVHAIIDVLVPADRRAD